jgi:ferredoxin-NADP reductase
MDEYQMTLVDRHRIARDTMAFWFDTNGANFRFRAGQHADLIFARPSMEVRATMPGPSCSQALLLTTGQS